MRFATQNELIGMLGPPPRDTSSLVRFISPFPLQIAWGDRPWIYSFPVHEIMHGPITKAFNEIFDCYGLDNINQLGIDQFGGCYNYRKMRGGSSWSKHAWAIAVDLDPARNGLRTKAPKAQFSKPEYNDLMGCFYRSGFVSLGHEKDYDYMHFELSYETIKG